MTKEEHFEQAVNAFGDDKLDEAIASYKKALEIVPDDPDAKAAMANVGKGTKNQ